MSTSTPSISTQSAAPQTHLTGNSKPGNPPVRSKILVVDDETGPRESVKVIFRDEHDVATASCGQDGVKYAQEHPIDLVVCDIRMPDLTGIDVLKQIKQIDPNIEVIMLTAYETLDTAREAIRYGASDYLNKPFDVRAMRETVSRCLENRRRKLASLTELVALQKRTELLQREVVNSNRALTAGVLSSGVIHDVNNPLSIIMIKAEMMQMKLQAQATPDQNTINAIKSDLDIVNREAERCRTITRRFLNLSRRKDDCLETLQVKSVILDVLALLKAHPSASDKDLLKITEDESLTVQANPSEVFQILVNLGVNAMQAMKSRGKLTISARQCRSIQPSLGAVTNPPAAVHRSSEFNPNQQFVEIAVMDTGGGIPADVLPKIFEPFFTTKPRGEGTGLGLAICAQLVDHYRGALKVASTVGVGTTCSVFLPLAK